MCCASGYSDAPQTERVITMKWTHDQTSEWFDAQFARLDIKQGEFADLVGVSPADMSRYKARKQEPRVAVLESIADALGLDIVEVMIGMGLLDPNRVPSKKVSHNKKIAYIKKAKKIITD